MQGQRLHLSIYHTDWPAKCTSALPLSFPLSPISLPSLSVFHSLHTHSIPASSSSDCASPIYPSIFCLQPSISHPWHPSRPLSPSLFLCVSFCIFLSSCSHCLRVRTLLKCPEGPSFKHRNQKHMAHFQLPRSITAIYPEIAAKFPKVSSRFTTDCNVCLSYFKSGQFPLAFLHSPRLSIKYFKGFQVGFRHVLSLVIMCPIFFASALLGPSAACNTNLITCKLEISPDPSK